MILERLCEQYYVYEDTDKFQKKIIQEVREIIEELRTDSKAQKELEDWLNKNQDDVRPVGQGQKCDLQQSVKTEG